MNVQSIIGSKGTEVATISQTASLHDAVQALGERGIGALVVSGDGRAIEGIVSERDIVRAAARSGAAALDATVGSVMSTDVITAWRRPRLPRPCVRIPAFRVLPVPSTGPGGGSHGGRRWGTTS